MAITLLAGSSAVFATEPRGDISVKSDRAPLAAAFNAYLEHQGRWAYTETHFGKGQPPIESIFRFDPSLRYAEQYQPIKLAGNGPTEKQIKRWAQRGEKEAERREKNIGPHEGEVHLRIYNENVTPLIDQAVLISEDEASATYEIPMRRKDSNDALFDKFSLTARVSKRRPDFEKVTIRQLTTVRAGAGKFSEGLIEIDFSVPDSQFPAVPVKFTSSTTNKPLLGKAHVLRNIAERIDLKHVIPYDERAKVKIGIPRTIEF